MRDPRVVRVDSELVFLVPALPVAALALREDAIDGEEVVVSHEPPGFVHGLSTARFDKQKGARVVDAKSQSLCVLCASCMFRFAVLIRW